VVKVTSGYNYGSLVSFHVLFQNTLFTSVPAVGGRVFDNVFSAGCDASGRLDLNTYLEGYNKVSLLVTGGQQMAFYFGMFASNADTMTGEG